MIPGRSFGVPREKHTMDTRSSSGHWALKPLFLGHSAWPSWKNELIPRWETKIDQTMEPRGRSSKQLSAGPNHVVICGHSITLLSIKVSVCPTGRLLLTHSLSGEQLKIKWSSRSFCAGWQLGDLLTHTYRFVRETYTRFTCRQTTHFKLLASPGGLSRNFSFRPFLRPAAIDR